MARPSIFTPVLAERICKLIAEGASKRGLCELPDMPNRSTLDDWLHKDSEFSSQYARACEARTEAQAEEIIEIADRQDLAPDHKRVMVDARKWVASKLLPKVYGEKVQVTAHVSLEQLVGASLPPTE